MYAMKNRREDLRPWAIIIAIAPFIPNFVLERSPAIISPMWLTDEYAISDFRSDWRRQISDVRTPPTSAIDSIGDSSLMFMVGNDMIIRANPYPPSFSRIAASTIDPATGAST